MTAMVPYRPASVRPHWRYLARQLAWAGIDLIFPPRCGGCARPGRRFCSACVASLHRLPESVCEKCGYPLRVSGRCSLCGLLADSALAGVRSAAFFEGPLQRAVHQLKYKRDVILADSLASELQAAWRQYALPGDRVVPVPLSAGRLRERGYNQAALLARAFAELTGLAYAADGALRQRHTATQVGLAREQRRANVAGAFAGQPQHVAGRSVILIDDVCTTGATLAACAEALRAAGARQVWGLTLGRARHPEVSS